MRILVADDHPIVRSGLRAVFESVPGFEVIDDVAAAEEAVAACARGGVDVVTMDLRFPEGMSGVEAIRAIRVAHDAPAVLVLTNYDNDADILGAIEAGASGYLLKDSAPADLIAGVRRAAAGQPVLAPVVATRS